MATPPTTPADPAPPAGTPTATPAAPRSGRLRNGELRRRVARLLADHPGHDFTPGEAARTLDRSSGAVGNALAVLARRGDATRTSTTPARYRATATTATAATAPLSAARRSTPATPPAASTATTGTTTTVTAAAPVPARTGTPATGGDTPSAATPVTGPVPRPNGQLYHPRTLSGLPDVTALRTLREAGVPALLYGPPGTGKTSVVEAAFPDLVTVAGDGDTTVADLVGEYTQTPDGRFVFVHGPLVTAMREGRPLFLDDATLIPPMVLAVVYPGMDGRRRITIKANGGEVVDAAPGFYPVAGHNPGVHGAVLSDALASRFSAHIAVSTDYDLATQLHVDPRAVRVARNLATRFHQGEIGWAPQLRELIAFGKIADALGPMTAAANLIGVAPEDDRDTVAGVVRDVFGTTVAPLALGARIPPTT